MKIVRISCIVYTHDRETANDLMEFVYDRIFADKIDLVEGF